MIRDAIDREVEAVDSGEPRHLCALLILTNWLNFSFFAQSQTFSSIASPRSSSRSYLHSIDLRLSLCCLEFFFPSFCVSEYQLAKPSDSHRKEMLFGSLAKPGHPMGKFCWGELANTTAGTHNTHKGLLELSPTQSRLSC